MVGAGAAGLATAAFLSRRRPDRTVVVLESARKPGAKILVSGGSRCNVTNVAVTERDFWGGSRSSIRQVLRAFDATAARHYFEGLGVPLHEEHDGKLFPNSNRSRDVLEALLRELAAAGATLCADHRVASVGHDGHRFIVTTSHGAFDAAQLVVATGGRALPRSGSDGAGYGLARAFGHTIVDTTPALAPLTLGPGSPHAALSGVSHQAELSVWVDGRVEERVTGSLLWTHFGISGPVALNVSRLWARARLDQRTAAVTMNVAPGRGFDDIDQRLTAQYRDRPRAAVGTLLDAWVPEAVGAALLASVGIERMRSAAQVDRDARRRLAHALHAWPLAVTDTRGYTFAEATAGGVSLAEIDTRTMESKKQRGLYFVGEVLDVDGRLGGYNFQWAWSSAWVAARALAANGGSEGSRKP